MTAAAHPAQKTAATAATAATAGAPTPAPAPSRSSGRRPRRRLRTGTAVRYLVLLVMLVVLAGPLLWQLSLSFKGPQDDLYERPPQLIPSDPTLDNFAGVLQQIPVLAFVGNSFIVAGLVIGGNIVLATLAGFALGRLRWRLRPVATGVFVAAMLVPDRKSVV